MEEWLRLLIPWGTEVLVRLQSLCGSQVDPVWKFFTFLGNAEFTALLLATVYWCIRKRTGAVLICLSPFSTWLGDAVKYAFNIPRPADPRLRLQWVELTPSFLSGHSLSAVALYGLVAARLRKPAVTVVCAVVIAGIAASRMFLGFHFPQDVIGGLLLGLALLAVLHRAEPAATRRLAARTVPVQLAVAVAVPAILIFVHPANPLAGYPAPGAVRTMAMLMGAGVGLVMERALLRFRVDGPLGQRALRLALGLAPVVVIYFGLGLLVDWMAPGGLAYPAELAVAFLRYGLVGWTLTFGAPWLFCRAGLAGWEGADRVAAGRLG